VALFFWCVRLAGHATGKKMETAMKIAIAAAAATLLFAAPASAAVCREAPGGAAMHFWVGEWKVVAVADGSPQGESRIESVLGGCAIIEHWRGVDAGDEGKSLFTFDARSGLWDQVWVTQDTSRPGGLKNKHEIATYPDGGIRFQGTLFVKPGVTVLDRTTLTPQKDGRVRQTIEMSRDGGTTWQDGFDAYYVRR
jgi:hypothetical protein